MNAHLSIGIRLWLRRSTGAVATASICLAIAAMPGRGVVAQDISVTGGDVQSNSTSASYSSLTVSGTSAGGSPSTYTADAPLSVSPYLITVSDKGVFNANADVTNYWTQVINGVLNLNSGTLASSYSLTLNGATVNQAGGHYAASQLDLSASSLTFNAGDSVGSYLYLSNAAQLTLAQNLSTYQLGLSSGASILRTNQTMSLTTVAVNNATLNLLAGDTLGVGSYYNEISHGGIVNTAAGAAGWSLGAGFDVRGVNPSNARSTLNVNGNATAVYDMMASDAGIINLVSGTLSARSIVLSGAGALAQNGGHFAVTSGYLGIRDGAAVTYGPGDSLTTSVEIANGGNLTLGQDLSVGTLTLRGASSSFTPAGHGFTAGSFLLQDHATMTSVAGGTIANYLSVSEGSTYTLDRNLTLSDRLGVSSAGSISRTTQTISALAFDVNDASLTLIAGDSFTGPGSQSRLMYGGVVSTAAGTILGSVQVYGRNGANAPATLDIGGDTTAGQVLIQTGGVLQLRAGSLTASGLTLQTLGNVARSGGHYVVDTLALQSGATLDYGLGDSIGSLSIDGAGSLLDELSPLSVTSLSVSGGGVLRLGSFTGSGAVSNWGLQWAGDHTTYLQGLIAGNFLTGGSIPLTVLFDAGSNATYVTGSSSAVPEIDPAGIGSILALASGALCLLERRRLKAA
ncbi:MAG: hypothetical protein WCJ31_14265 [Planctomycetia bacterium]